MKFQLGAVAIATIICCGCSTSPAIMDGGASTVRVAKSDPPDNYSEIGPITVVDGGGCGGFGSRGSYDNAVIKAKNKALGMGGDYVQVFTITEPHFRPGCFDNKYVISGSVFKQTSDAPSPMLVKGLNNNMTAQTGAERLRDLKRLLDEGIITQREYDDQKQRLLKEGL